MNTEEKKEISELLADVRGALKTVTKTQSELSKLEAAFDKLGDEVAALGEPAFDDVDSIEKLSLLRKQRELCQRRIESLEAGFGAFRNELQPLWRRFSPIAVKLLAPVFDRCRQTVTAAMRPFFANEPDASAAASQTPMVLQVGARVQYFTSGLVSALSNPSTAVVSAEKMEAVLAEALKEYPDFLQFLAPAGFGVSSGASTKDERRLGGSRPRALAGPTAPLEVGAGETSEANKEG